MVTNMTLISSERDEPVYRVGKWNHGAVYRLTVSIFKGEGDEDYTALALNLPGAAGCGGTHDEAVESLKESVLGLLKAYKGNGDPIPWEPIVSDEFANQRGCVKRVILLATAL